MRVMVGTGTDAAGEEALLIGSDPGGTVLSLLLPGVVVDELMLGVS